MLPPTCYHLQPTTHNLPSTTYHLQPTTFNLPPTTYHLQPTTYNLPPTTYHLQPTTYNLPPTTYHLQPEPTTYNLPPTCYHLQLTTYNLPPTTYHLQLTTYNLPYRHQRRRVSRRSDDNDSWMRTGSGRRGGGRQARLDEDWEAGELEDNERGWPPARPAPPLTLDRLHPADSETVPCWGAPPVAADCGRKGTQMSPSQKCWEAKRSFCPPDFSIPYRLGLATMNQSSKQVL